MLDGWNPGEVTYEHPDLGDDPEDDPYLAADLALTVRIQALVDLHYPGHPWLVMVSHAQRNVQVHIPILMGMTNKYLIPIDEVLKDPQMSIITKFCGEILERYNLPRQKFDRDHFLEALESIPIHLRGTHGYIPS